MTNRIVLHLTGGLGNQLFQLAAAASSSENIEIECSLGKPRCADGVTADLFNFKLPFQVTKSKPTKRIEFLAGKAIGFALRSAVAPKGLENTYLISKMIDFSVSCALFIRTKNYFVVRRGKGVGFSPIKKTQLNSYLVGYFQSYQYPQAVYSDLMRMEPIEIGPELKSLMEFAPEEKPLVVHFRLGDYLQERNFGIPGNGYYLKAISEAWKSNRYKSIWVFSDDLQSAKNYFPRNYLEHVRWIEEVDSSPVSTLQAMRLGFGYIIANSTFSWWGAYLSFRDDAPVTAPNPWFRGMESPNEIVPPTWRRLDSDF